MIFSKHFQRVSGFYSSQEPMVFPEIKFQNSLYLPMNGIVILIKLAFKNSLPICRKFHTDLLSFSTLHFPQMRYLLSAEYLLVFTTARLVTSIWRQKNVFVCNKRIHSKNSLKMGPINIFLTKPFGKVFF